MLSGSNLYKSVNFFQNVLLQQTRNTFILKRRVPPPLHKKNGKVQKMKARNFIYDLVQDTNTIKKTEMSVILKTFVQGVGREGDIISLSPNEAYSKYIVPGLAVYHTPKNEEKYKKIDATVVEETTYSSPYAQRTMDCLSRLVLQITMNKLVPWTLEKWHIRASFRKAGFVVPEEAIEMPSLIIKGPDLSLQEKEFYVTVTVNKTEKVNVRCRIHHWAIGLDRLEWTEFHWKKPLEPLIPEQAEVLEKMPLPA